MPDLSIPTILSLAAADAVNPCEIAVLTLVLINILVHDPKNLKKVLFAGLAFSTAIFLTYIVSGACWIKIIYQIRVCYFSNNTWVAEYKGLYALQARNNWNRNADVSKAK